MVLSVLTHYAIGPPVSEDFGWPGGRRLSSRKPLRLALGLMILLISHLLAVFFTTGRNTQPDMRLVECVLQKGR